MLRSFGLPSRCGADDDDGGGGDGRLCSQTVTDRAHSLCLASLRGIEVSSDSLFLFGLLFHFTSFVSFDLITPFLAPSAFGTFSVLSMLISSSSDNNNNSSGARCCFSRVSVFVLCEFCVVLFSCGRTEPDCFFPVNIHRHANFRRLLWWWR